MVQRGNEAPARAGCIGTENQTISHNRSLTPFSGPAPIFPTIDQCDPPAAMKHDGSIIFVEILLLVILLLSFFTSFPIPPEVLSKNVVGWLIGACVVLIVTHRMLGR